MILLANGSHVPVTVDAIADRCLMAQFVKKGSPVLPGLPVGSVCGAPAVEYETRESGGRQGRCSRHPYAKWEYQYNAPVILPDPNNLADAMAMSGVPSRFMRASLSDFPPEFAKISTNGLWLYVQGPNGSGKTHLACALIGAFKRSRPLARARLKVCADLFSELRKGAAGGFDALRSLDFVEFLVLDDLGSENPTDFVAEQLFRLLNHRWSSNMATVVTSNWKHEDLFHIYQTRVISRLAEAKVLTLEKRSGKGKA